MLQVLHSPSFAELGERISKLLEEKNAAYGNSFDKAGEFLRLLYPQGVKPEQMEDALCLVRIFDKMMRIATKKDAFGESPYQDIAGYAILGLRRSETRPATAEELPGVQQLTFMTNVTGSSSVEGGGGPTANSTFGATFFEPTTEGGVRLNKTKKTIYKR